MNHLVTNLHGRYTRVESRGGRDFLVVPMVMLREGVHNGSGGPLFYEGSELERTASLWNGKPIVIRHPTRNGQSVSANDPGVLAKQGVGTVENASWSGRKLRAEAWIDMCRLTELDQELDDRLLHDGFVLEVSTGLYTTNIREPGHYGGKDFQFRATNHKPDHLALLPEGHGACSVADGCGLMQVNQEYHQEESTMRNKNHLPMPKWDFGHETPIVNHAHGHGPGLQIPTLGYEAPSRTPWYGSGLPLPSMGFEPPPVLNRGTGDRDDNLPLPKMDFGPACGCGDPVANAADDGEGLALPKMNFGPCGCGRPVANSGGHDYNKGLPLPSTL